MPPALPSRRHLAVTWVVLAALTVAAMVAGRVGEAGRLDSLGLWGSAAVLLVSGFKARQILWVYLNLGAVRGGWKGVFVAYLVMVGAVVLGAYAAAGSIVHR